jgi:sugar-specific transcriptional regulator TrmB
MKELFKNLGASEKEMETFLKLLELGAQPVSVIARHMGVPRSSMYLILENLKKIGIVEEFERAAMRYFKCISVKAIADVLEAKESKIRHTIEILDKNLPQLKVLENKFTITPKVKFFEGKEAVMKMYEGILKEKSFCAYFNPQVENPVMEIYFKKVEKAIKASRLDVREFVVDGPKGRRYKKDCATKNHKIKILPKDATFDSDNFICEDRICMVSYDEKEVSAVVIFSEQLVRTQKAIFEQLWANL